MASPSRTSFGMGSSYIQTLCLIVLCLASTVGGANVAQGKTAHQTSLWERGEGAASRAVDGNAQTTWESASCSHTDGEDNPSWWVDLGQAYSIDRVVIYNRQDDCCWERINPFNIHIGHSDQVNENPECGGDHQFSTNVASVSVSCQGMRGRYVGVRLPGTSRVLTLCEVQVFPVPHWHRVFATVSGTGQSVYDAWTAGDGADIKHDRHPMVEQWGSLALYQVKVVFEYSQSMELIFNGQNTNKNNWFTKNRLWSSPWNDINSEPINYFSIEGHADLKRRFFINRQYNGCDRDMGWLVVAEMGQSAGCNYERPPTGQLPYIRVSSAGRSVNWNNDNGFITADRMVIYIDSERCDHCEQNCTYTDGDFQCSCHAGYVLNEDGASCDDADECLTENGGCDHICTNTEGSFQCSCNPGYLLNANGLACDDVCLTATTLYVPHRSTAYVTEQEPDVCDNELVEGWYRFTHAGGTIPTSCVGVYRCSTEYTIWMNGSHPTDDTITDRVACVNTGEDNSCCSDQYSMTIQVKRCPTPGHTYYVYRLVPVPEPATTGGDYYGEYYEYYGEYYGEGQPPTPSRCTAYCAGDSEPCPNGEEYNVFHRACGNIFPLFSDNPVLHPPEYDVSNNQVTFTCEIQFDPDDVTAWFDVMFLFDDEYFPDVPNVTLTAGKRRAKMDASHLGLNQLYPNVPVSWPSKMGKDVSCQVRSYWEGTPDVKSEWQQSNSYWAGIQSVEDTVVVHESADHYKLELTSTVPFVCEGGEGQCYVDVPLTFDRNDDDVCVAEGCHVRFYADNWSDTEHMVKGEAVLVAVRDGQQDGDKQMGVSFGQISHAPVAYNVPHIFHGYAPQVNVQVRTVDSLEATCTYAGDPHGVSFDEHTGAWRKQIHVIIPGEFIMYRSTRPGRNFEVHSRLKTCGWGRLRNKVSCNCGVAVREDNDVVIVDYCSRNSPIVAYKTALGGPLSPGVVVTQDSNGKYIKISMPSGAYVEVVGSGFVTLRVHAPGIDKGYTEGLCGTFDGNPNNDRMMPDGSISPHYVWPRWHRDFSYAWQIPRGESLFDVECPEEVSNPLSETEFCTCGSMAECSATKTRKNNHLNPALNVIHPLQDGKNKNCTPPPEVIEEDPVQYNDDVCDTEYEFVYEEDEEPEINDEWPTPDRGITEEEARGKCQGGILNLTIAEDCRDVYGVDIFSGVDFCVADVKVTEDFQYVDIIVQKIQAECAEKAYNNVSLYETNDDGTVKPPAFIAENLCPRQCSNQGRCVNSTCECNEGYTSADCSIQVGRSPVALELPSDGLCDVRSRPCMKTSFFAEPVMDSENLTCRITQVQIKDGIKAQANSSGRSEATFRSFGEVSCALPRSPVRDGSPDTKEGAVAHGMLLSVSNDGERFSEELFFTVYDSVCQECSQGGNCTWKPNTCIIRGHCFRNEDPNPNNICEQCVPELSNSAWSDRPDNEAPVFTAPSTIKKLPDESLTINLGAEDPEGGPVTCSLTSAAEDGVSVQPNGQLDWTAVDVNSTMNVTVEDECGASSEQTFHLTTMACPCENGGSCVPDPDMPRGQGFYTCVCPGYTGDVCETELDECQSDPCANGGTCIDLVNGYNCTCTALYTGSHCDVEVADKCAALDPCYPEVSCVNLEDGGYLCGRCPAGYFGNGYECKDTDECESDGHGCLHGCNNLPGTYECTCPDGFVLIGDDCIDVDECKAELDQCSDDCTNTDGSYTCGCPEGYELDSDGWTCIDIDECSQDDCHECHNTPGSFECSCTDGYVVDDDGTACEDVDECELEIHECSHDCANTDGSYTCECPEGFNLTSDERNCTDMDECSLDTVDCHECQNTPGSFECSCMDGYDVSADGTSCEDVDECTSDLHECSHDCTNTDGNYTCDCREGFELDSDERTCNDVDECSLNLHECSDHCTNTDGSYTCGCPDGYELSSDDRTCIDVDECSSSLHECSHDCTNTDGSYTCGCPDGYSLSSDDKNCNDVDECDLGLHGCSHDCTNTDLSYQCGCPTGYQLMSDDKTCEDIDECSTNAHDCSHDCTNTEGSYTCDCRAGYKLDGDGRNCNDVNECESGQNQCSDDCTNTDGSYTCGCPAGWELSSDDRTCNDVDECSTNAHDCSHDCSNTDGSYTCDCRTGYELATDRRNCNDVDECALELDECSHDCTNTDGSYTCGCSADAYELNLDERTCDDVDECARNLDQCSDDCTNTVGSYTCTCPTGYELDSDGRTCNEVDECAAGIDQCSQECTNTDGSYTCSCPTAGFELDSDGKTCNNIDECASSPCQNGGECQDEVNQYACSCADGWAGTHCEEDIDECSLDSNDCHECQNSPGSFECSCRDGYVVSTSWTSCTDVNECIIAQHGCSHDCSNTDGSYTCTCPTGYKLNSDERNCDELVKKGCELSIDQIGGVKQIFTSALSNTQSSEFSSFSSRVEFALDEGFKNSSISELYEGSQVTSCRAGSIIVNFEVFLIQDSSSTVENVTNAFLEVLNGSTFGSSQITIVPSSWRVYEIAEANTTPAWYTVELYLTLVFAACAVVITAAVVAMVWWCGKHGRPHRKTVEVAPHPDPPPPYGEKKAAWNGVE